MTEPLYTMAFTTGLLGSGHCIGMCGGIVAALSISQQGRQGGFVFHLLYNSGRILTYTLIGLLVGWLGSAIAYTDAFAGVTRILLIASDLFIMVIGLGTAGLFRKINVMKLDFPGPVKSFTEAVTRLRKYPPAVSALPLGIIMGFLPCGFLYAMAITAGQSASTMRGALIMLFFGIGTVPSLFLFGSAAHWLSSKARNWMLRGAGIMVSLMGAYNLWRHLQMMGYL